MKEEFSSSEGGYETVARLNKTLKYHEVTDLKTRENELKNQKKKSKKKEEKLKKTYQVMAVLKSDVTKIRELEKRAPKICLSNK